MAKEKTESEAAKIIKKGSSSEVDFDRIELGFGNVRSTLTDIKELAAQIREQGLLQPLIVRHTHMKSKPHVLPDGRAVWDRYELIAGNRRQAAIALLRETDRDLFAKAKVTLVYGNDEDMVAIQLVENLGRVDMTPIDVANGFLFFKKCGLNAAQTAAKVGKSRAYVQKLLDFRERACGDLARAANRGAIGLDLAVEISRLPEGEQRAALALHVEKASAAGPRAASQETRAKLNAQNGGPVHAPPGRAALRKLVEFVRTNPTKPLGLSTEAFEAIEWCLGYRETLPGATEALLAAGVKPVAATQPSPSAAE